MKKGIFTGMLLFATLCVQAQSELVMMVSGEGKLMAVPKMKMYELNIPKLSYKTYTPSSRWEMDAKLRSFQSDIPRLTDERPMDMQVLSAAYQPFFNVFTPMIRRVSPMALDFNETSIVPVSDQVDFLVNGHQYTWPGMGGLTRITTQLEWRNDRWTVGGGAFAARYYTPFNPSPGFMGGVNVNTSYQATDWLKIRGWGQYADYGNDSRNPHMLMNPFYNHTQVGGALEFKLNDNFGVGAGVNYEFNPRNRKMEQQLFLFPVFYR